MNHANKATRRAVEYHDLQEAVKSAGGFWPAVHKLLCSPDDAAVQMGAAAMRTYAGEMADRGGYAGEGAGG